MIQKMKVFLILFCVISFNFYPSYSLKPEDETLYGTDKCKLRRIFQRHWNETEIIIPRRGGRGGRAPTTQKPKPEKLQMIKTDQELMSTSDAYLSVPQMISKYDYNAEIHNVTTKDGYILEIHRISGSALHPPQPGKTVVYLMHGLCSSSADWVLTGPGKGLAYILADQGYDVWMGNVRGNRYSKRHISYKPSKMIFWQFSWHEMGYFDLPAIIDYTLNQTSQEQLFYIGHSQGTTVFWVMASELPQYNQKVKLMQALSPIAFMSNLYSPLFQMAAANIRTLQALAKINNIYEIKSLTDFLKTAEIQKFCKESNAPIKNICLIGLFSICGYSPKQMNMSIVPIIFAHTPAGSSLKQIVHYGQLMESKLFRQYDYGLTNMQRYNALTPPEYDLKKITVPVALHYAPKDWLAAVIDVEKLASRLPNVIEKHLLRENEFNHIDFLWGNDAKVLVYDRVLQLLKENSIK